MQTDNWRTAGEVLADMGLLCWNESGGVQHRGAHARRVADAAAGEDRVAGFRAGEVGGRTRCPKPKLVWSEGRHVSGLPR
jgi:hypothetical protein